MNILSSLGDAYTTISNTFEWRDVIDIALIAYIIYAVITLVRQTRAAQLMRGIVILLIARFIALMLSLKTTNFLLENVLQFGLLAIVVVFQPELRRALEQVGRSKLSTLAIFSGKMSSDEISTWNDAIVTVCDSTERMAKERTGALIVIEMETSLGEIVRTGTKIDAAPTCELLETIFYEGTPLHDGAVVIRNGRVEAAGCLLPVSQNTDISRDMGTRHRAALGMSENSDAIIVVVSEESGIISIAQNGLIVRRLDKSNLFRILQNEIMPQPEEGEEMGKGFLGRFKKK
ncbi:MAG: diadenylate cyclase CdaA [Oscillospiraceae bacterium]